MCFLPSSVVFADLSPFMWLATKLVDKLTFQGSWFAEIAEPAKCLSPAALSMTRLFSDLGEKAGRCLWQVSFLPQTKTGNYCVVWLQAGVASSPPCSSSFMLCIFGIHRAGERAANTDTKRRSISVRCWTFSSEHNYTAVRLIYSLLLAVQPA